jgi:hypothetical protein
MLVDENFHAICKDASNLAASLTLAADTSYIAATRSTVPSVFTASARATVDTP